MKHGRQDQWFGSFAAITLVAWIGAQVLCAAHCGKSACQGYRDLGQVLCLDTVPVQLDHHHAESHHGAEPSSAPTRPDSGESSFCLAIKTALPGGSADTLFRPETHPLDSATPLLSTQDARLVHRAAALFRPFHRAIWIFTPDVCLGPAFRGHAPPFFLFDLS